MQWTYAKNAPFKQATDCVVTQRGLWHTAEKLSGDERHDAWNAGQVAQTASS